MTKFKEDDLLTGAQEVADALAMSVDTLNRWLKKYPWADAELPNGKPGGRWRVRRSDVLKWWDYVRRQETRHPEARRFRPEEPPEVALLQGRPEPPLQTREEGSPPAKAPRREEGKDTTKENAA